MREDASQVRLLSAAARARDDCSSVASKRGEGFPRKLAVTHLIKLINHHIFSDLLFFNSKHSVIFFFCLF